jgi:hypothetical protein
MQTLNKGDIVVTFNYDNSVKSVYWMYDHSIGITASVFGIKIAAVSKELDENGLKHKVFRINEQIVWSRKKVLNDFLIDLISQRRTLSFKQRVHFLEYILWVFKRTLGVTLIDSPVNVSIEALENSPSVLVIDNA